MNDHLAVSEIFGPTIQGEGPYLGQPATFLRLMGCNLACSWCDTPYTWDGNRYDLRREGRKMQVAEVATCVDEKGPGLLVISGGEPLLQQPALKRLLVLLGDREVHIETAGTIAPALPAAYVVSPKLDHSGNTVEMRYRPQAIEAFKSERVIAWKFVCQVPGDLNEVDALVHRHQLSPVYIMPEGTDQKVLRHRLKALLPGAIERGYTITPRLHVDAWGNERGR